MSDVYEIKQPSELLITINALQSEIKLSKEDAQVILGYMQGHDFMLTLDDSDGLFNKIDNVYEVIMNNSHEYYQKAKKENNDKIESLFYYIVNNQELLAKDRADILLTGSVKIE